MKYLIDKFKAGLTYIFFPQRRKQIKLARVLQNSEFFDARWYLNEYPDVASSGVSPQLHYILNGFTEGRLPGPLFNEEHYIAQLSETIPTGLPPLLHYEIYGKTQGLEPKKLLCGETWWQNFSNVNQPKKVYQVNSHSISKPVTIIVPIFNGAHFVKKCLDSVFQLKGAFTVILIDDCSDEIEISDLLNSYAHYSNVSIIRNSINKGFSKSINTGIQKTSGNDVIILNSDTIVPKSLILNLKYVAYREEKIGTVTPLSNSAGPFSISLESISSHQATNPTELTRLLSKHLELEPVEIPTGHGFCMYIKYNVIDSIGYFDEDAFPRGYGEENDFCFRARLAGWTNIVDPSTFVFHEGTKSFKAEKISLVENGLAKLNERYKDYNAQIQQGFSSRPFQFMKQRVSSLIDNLEDLISQSKPRILFVIATEDGGTAKTNKDLMKSIQDKYETFLLKSNSRRISIYFVSGKEEFHLQTYYLKQPITPNTHASSEYDNLVLDLLHFWSIELIHVRQIAWHSVGLVEEALKLGIPTIYSIHDFYPVCPSVKLLDNNDSYCGGKCTAGSGMCNIELWPKEYFANLKHYDIEKWRHMFNTMLTHVHSIITTSNFVKNTTIQNLPAALDKPFHIIPHGRDFANFACSSSRPKEGKNIKLLMLGTIAKSKGSSFILPILEKFPNYEIHLLGKLADINITHPRFYEYGAYKRDELSIEIAKIKPSWGLLLSIWPETWCHTLTEMWASGLPVVAFNNGAVKERICKNKCGVLVKSTDLDDLFKILSAVSGEMFWQEYANNVIQWQNNEGKSQNLDEMSHQYTKIYEDIINKGNDEICDINLIANIAN